MLVPVSEEVESALASDAESDPDPVLEPSVVELDEAASEASVDADPAPASPFEREFDEVEHAAAPAALTANKADHMEACMSYPA